MGVDVHIAMGHTLDREGVLKLSSILNKEMSALSEIWNKKPSKPSIWSPDGDVEKFPLSSRLDKEFYYSFDGPLGFCGCISENSIYFYHVTRWWGFIENESAQKQLLKSGELFATILGASEFVFVPDSACKESLVSDLVCDNKSYSEIITYLRACGEPSKTIKNLENSYENAECMGYYIHKVKG